MPRWIVIAARISIVVYIAMVGYVCFADHFSFLPDLSKPIFGFIPQDKVIHFIMFFPFPILLYYTVSKRFGSKRAKGFLTLLAAGLILAILTEIGQLFIPNRDTSGWDFLADSTAIVLSSLIVLWIDTIRCHKQ